MWVNVVYYGVLAALLGAAAYTDARRREIPNVVPLLILAAGVLKLVGVLLTGNNIAGALFAASGGALLGFLLMLFPALRSKLGGGDVKLSGAAGFGIGFPYILHFLLISLTLAMLYGLVRLLRAKRAERKSCGVNCFSRDDPGKPELTLPLAPFMLCGALCLLVSGAVNMFLHY